MPLELKKNALFYFKQNAQTFTLYAHINNRWYLIIVCFIKLAIRIKADCMDRSLAIDDGTGLSGTLSSKFVADAILVEQEKELPADHPYLFFRWC